MIFFLTVFFFFFFWRSLAGEAKRETKRKLWGNCLFSTARLELFVLLYLGVPVFSAFLVYFIIIFTTDGY